MRRTRRNVGRGKKEEEDEKDEKNVGRGKEGEEFVEEKGCR